MDDDAKQTLEEICKWTKTIAHDILRDQLEELSEEKKKVYELSTKENSRRDIANNGPVGYGTVTRWQEAWFKQGLMEKIAVSGGDRFVRIDSLENFGIEVPEVVGDEDE